MDEGNEAAEIITRHLHVVADELELERIGAAPRRSYRPHTHRACNGQGCAECDGRGYFVLTEGRAEDIGAWPLYDPQAPGHSVNVTTDLEDAAARLLGACDALRRFRSTGTVDELLGRELAALENAWPPNGRAS